MKDLKAKNTEEPLNGEVSVPSSRDQSTQTEMSADQKSMRSEFELDCSNDVLDIYEDMHNLFRVRLIWSN